VKISSLHSERTTKHHPAPPWEAYLRFRGGWRLHELPDGIENGFELGVLFAFQGIEFSGEFVVRRQHLAEFNKRPHDGDVDLDGAAAAEAAGEHGDALFGEGVGRVAAVAPT